MPEQASVITYFLQAGPLVKVLMLFLMSVSVISWALIFQRAWYLKHMRNELERFSERFWSGVELAHLYRECESKSKELEGIWNIFLSGFREFARHRGRMSQDTQAILDAVRRCMQVALNKEMDRLEQHLGFLATVGSVSPYVGLLGTVWGIMSVLQALGQVQQASIAMVAPGISETLVATAMGLFAAIPAVVAYNRYRQQVDRILLEYDSFVDEFTGILFRQSAMKTPTPTASGATPHHAPLSEWRAD